jgi:hypothetical protein
VTARAGVEAILPGEEASPRGIATSPVAVGVEATPKRVFASALEWPGWSRTGRDEAAALAALAGSVERYAVVAREAGVTFAAVTRSGLSVVERLPGTPSTAFGVPAVVFAVDRRPTDAADGERLAALVRAAWTILAWVVEAAPAELRKGPRGGGRDRDAIVAHVVGAEHAYAPQVGLRLPEPDPLDGPAVAAVRAAIAEVLARPTDGGPIPGGRWPARYAARRVAWHVLDHAWEIEDRADPA